MKETKEMMKILSENKKRIQTEKKSLKRTKSKAFDIMGTIWLGIVYSVIVYLISLI